MPSVYFVFFANFYLTSFSYLRYTISKGVEQMTTGEKTKKIRTSRGNDTKGFGLAIGLEEKGADSRIAQYGKSTIVSLKEICWSKWRWCCVSVQ